MTIEATFVPPRRLPSLPLLLGSVVSAAVILAALISLFWTPHGATLFSPLADPDAAHWLGTDPAGRDVVSALMSASFGTLLLAVFGTLLGLFVGIPIGAALAVYRGSASALGSGFVLPAGLIVGLVLSALSAVGNLTVILAIALPGILFALAATRHLVAPFWAQDFVTGARIAGLGPIAATQRHVLPRLLPKLGALAAKLLALAILLELGLSFAGLGTLPPGASLGLLLREAQPFGLARPLLVIAPGLLALTIVLGLKLIAFGLDGGSDGRR